MNQPEKPRYATLFSEVRVALGISIAEYYLLETVYHLSHKTGYCYKTASSMAFDMGVTKQGINKMIARLCEKGLLERLTHNAIRVTDTYRLAQSVTGNKVSTRRKSGNKVTKVETKLTDRKLSSPKNNNENNKEYEKAREASAKIRASLPFLSKRKLPKNPN